MENRVKTVNNQVFLEMYTEADEWADNLNLTFGELNFFRKVIGLYLQGKDKESTDNIQKLTTSLTGLEEERRSLYEKIESHKYLLDDYINEKEKPGETIILEKHDGLRSTYSKYIKQIREFKDELFGIMDRV